MITFIIKSYLITMLAVLAGSLVLFMTGLFYIFNTYKKGGKKAVKTLEKDSDENKVTQKPLMITSHDINAIAGDDALATQLDLARAYIETGKIQLAKKILSHVIEKGTVIQKQEAHTLLGLI